MSHLDIYNLSTDGEFKVRFASALAAYVPLVLAEPALTPNHDARVVQAIKVLNDPHAHANRLAMGAAAAFGGVMPTDAALDAIVVQYWDVLATAPVVP